MVTSSTHVMSVLKPTLLPPIYIYYRSHMLTDVYFRNIMESVTMLTRSVNTAEQSLTKGNRLVYLFMLV